MTWQEFRDMIESHGDDIDLGDIEVRCDSTSSDNTVTIELILKRIVTREEKAK